jgi:FLVCR family MFS transporter 7
MSDLKEKLVAPGSPGIITQDLEAETQTSILIEERKQDSKAYFMLAIYMICMSTSGYNLLYIQPIARSIKKAFDATDSNLNILVSIGSISSSLFFLPLTYLVAMKGLKFALIVGLLLLLGGTILELFIVENFNLVYIGHFITHAGNPILNIANAKFCSIWFTPKLRPLAVTLIAMTSTVGIMIAFIIPGLFVDGDSTLDIDEIKTQVRHFHIFLTILYSAILLLALVIFQEAPSNYKTYYAEERTMRRNFRMFKQLWDLFSDVTYLLFVVVLGVGISSVIINQLLIVQMMTPFHFTQNQCQLGGAIIVLAGLIGSITYSKYFIHYPNQLRKLRGLYLAIILAYTLFSYMPTTEKLPLLYLGCAVLGFFGMIQISIGIESLLKYIIITGPQRLVVGSAMVQIVLSMCNGVLSFGLRDFLMENTQEGIFKLNVTIMAILFVTFLLSVLLQASFEAKVAAALRQDRKPSLLPKAPRLSEAKKTELMDSLLKDR